MLSLPKAFHFTFQPATFIVSFFWLVFHALSLICGIQFIKNAFLSGQDLLQMLQTMNIGIKIYTFIYMVGYTLTFIYILIVAKKKTFENPPSFSLSFFIRTAAVLLPSLILYSFVFRCFISLIILSPLAGKISAIVGLVLISYLFWAFIASYVEHFNFSSVRRLFVPILQKPQLIFLWWICGIGYTLVAGVIIYYLAQGTRSFVQWLLPTLAPCGALSAVFTFIGFSIVMSLIYKGLSRKGRVLLIASSGFMIPSLILYYIIDMPFINSVMFLLILQICWYWFYFYLIIVISTLAFSANLLTQITREVSGLPRTEDKETTSSGLLFP